MQDDVFTNALIIEQRNESLEMLPLANKHTYLILTILMMIWGFNVSAIKILVEQFTPIAVTSIRVLIAGITVFVYLSLIGVVRLPKKKEWGYILGGTIFNVVCHHFFIAEGLIRTSAANAGLILGLGPLITVVLSMILLKQRPSFLRLFGFIIGLIGVSITVLAGTSGVGGNWRGDLFVLSAILSQAFSFILIKKAAQSMDTRLLTGYMTTFGAFILAALSLWKEPGGFGSLANINLPLLGILLFSAIIATGFGHIIYNYSIGKIGPSETSIFLNLNTFFSLVGAVLFLQETFLPAHLFGLLFIVSGVLLGSGGLEAWLIQRKRKRV